MSGYSGKRFEFDVPVHQGDNPVCQECKNCFPHIFHDCWKACSHLMSWASHEARFAVQKEMARHDRGVTQ